MLSKTAKTTTIAAAVAITLAGATAAHADSIAYVKGGDVYLSTTDGSRQFQVTSGGGYEQVSQSGDGTPMAVASASAHIRKLDRFGNVLADFPVPVSDHSPGPLRTFQGPFDIDVSPNGQKLGYGYYETGFYQDPTTGHISARSNNGTAFTSTSSESGFTDSGYKYASSWDAPEFVDDDNVLVSNGPLDAVVLIGNEQVGSGDIHSWFYTIGYPHPMEAAISRNKRVLAYVSGPDRAELRIIHDTNGQLGFPQGADLNVESCFSYTADSGAKDFADPTFNADGSRGFWAAEGAIQTAPFNMAATGKGCGQGVNSVKIVEGGSSPDWGPADVPTSRPAPPAPPAGPGAAVQPAKGTVLVPGAKNGGSGGSSGGSSTAGGGSSLSVSVAKASLRKALKSGLTIKVGGTGAITATARSGSKVVGSGKAGAKASSVKITFTKKAKKTLKHARKATLKVSVTRSGRTASTTVRLAK